MYKSQLVIGTKRVDSCTVALAFLLFFTLGVSQARRWGTRSLETLGSQKFGHLQIQRGREG